MWHSIRDITLFLAGLGGFIHEVLLQKGERPTVMAGALAMMGVVAFLKADEKRGK